MGKASEGAGLDEAFGEGVATPYKLLGEEEGLAFLHPLAERAVVDLYNDVEDTHVASLRLQQVPHHSVPIAAIIVCHTHDTHTT